MRVVSIHPDVIVFISGVWQTTCTAVRAGEEGFVIDSPVYPDELDAVPGVLEQARFPVSGLLATHGDWDHLLGRLAFPDMSLGCAESTVARLATEPGAAQRELRAFDADYYVAGRRPLSLTAVQSLPVPGHLELGAKLELDLHPAVGHTVDGVAFWMPSISVLVCGDYLSSVEIPVIAAGGSLDGYLETLERLRPLVGQAETVVPGHGRPLTAADARARLDEDRAYLEALRRDGDAAPLPHGRASSAQRRIHAENAARV